MLQDQRYHRQKCTFWPASGAAGVHHKGALLWLQDIGCILQITVYVG